MGDKTIPDSAEPRLESFYPLFVAGIDLPHQGVVDSYSLVHPAVRDKRRVSEIDLEYHNVTKFTKSQKKLSVNVLSFEIHTFKIYDVL